MNNITLAICAYNCEHYIEETLTCIVNQTFQDFDLLIVNDCSTDNSKEIIEQFFKKSHRQYNLVDFKENRGIAFGRKYVFEHTFTKYIVFVDSDDKPYPKLIERLYGKIESDSNLMAVGCYHEYININGKKIGGGLFLGEKTSEEFIKKANNQKLIFMQPTAIIDREIALKAGGINISGFFEGKPRYQDLCEDLDLWTRMSDFYKEGKAIIVIPEVLSQYRKMEHTASTNTVGMTIKMKFVKSNLLRRRGGLLEETFIEFFNSITPKQMDRINKGAIAAIALREGVFLFKKGKMYGAFKNIMQSIFTDPGYLWQKIKSNSGLFR